MKGSKSRLLLAAAAGLAAGCAGTNASKKGPPNPMVQCWGVNNCAAQGACASKRTTCAGTNSCKGRGWVDARKLDCEARGGRLSE